jgi:hypothetical protein
MNETLKEMETELASLKQELIDIANAIKVCRTKDEREELFEDKKICQWDIEEVTNEIARYKELLAETEGEESSQASAETETPNNDETETVETEEV